VDFKLENVLVSLHSLKTMGSALLFVRNGELLGHSPILHICIAVGDPVIEMGGLGSSHQEERVEIQLPRWEGWDPVIKRRGLRSSYRDGRVGIQLTGLTPTHICVRVPSKDLDIQRHMSWTFCVQ
jgi:hypothetical protein